MQAELERIILAPMTAEKYCSFFSKYENDYRAVLLCQKCSEMTVIQPIQNIFRVFS